MALKARSGYHKSEYNGCETIAAFKSVVPLQISVVIYRASGETCWKRLTPTEHSTSMLEGTVPFNRRLEENSVCCDTSWNRLGHLWNRYRAAKTSSLRAHKTQIKTNVILRTCGNREGHVLDEGI